MDYLLVGFLKDQQVAMQNSHVKLNLHGRTSVEIILSILFIQSISCQGKNTIFMLFVVRSSGVCDRLNTQAFPIGLSRMRMYASSCSDLGEVTFSV